MPEQGSILSALLQQAVHRDQASVLLSCLSCINEKDHGEWQGGEHRGRYRF